MDELYADYGEDLNPDVDAAWNKVRRRVAPAPAPRLRLAWVWSVAAGLALLAAAFFLLAESGSTTIFNDGNDLLVTSLPDGTNVTLQSGSKITFGTDFNDTERLVDLEGQAFFQVAKDRQRPFLVRNDDTELVVTGTAFNLRLSDEELEVDVIEGSVELIRNEEKYPVGASQCGLAKPGEKLVNLMDTPAHNRHGWRTGQFSYDNASLSDVVAGIEKTFGVTVTGVDPGCNQSISGKITGSDPATVLHKITLLVSGEVEQRGDEKHTYHVDVSCK